MSKEIDIFWWGSEIHLRHGNDITMLPASDAEQAINNIVAYLNGHKQGTIRGVRLIYQPDHLSTENTDCPNAKRKHLRESLTPIYPVLKKDSVAWSYQRIIPHQEGFGTFVHFENKPALRRLSEAFKSLRINVLGAWPLMSLLELLGANAQENSLLLVGMLLDNRAALYNSDQNDTRDFQIFEGTNRHAEFASAVAQATKLHIETELSKPTLILVEQNLSFIQGLPEGTAILEQTATTHIPFQEIFGYFERLNPKDTANLYRRETKPKPNLILNLVSVALLLSAAALGYRFYANYQDINAKTQYREERKAALSKDNETLRLNRAKIQKYDRLIKELSGTGNSRSLLLNHIEKTIPPEITLSAIRFNDSSFSIEGFRIDSDSENEEPLKELYRELFSDSVPWRLAEDRVPGVDRNSRFTFNGIIDP